MVDLPGYGYAAVSKSEKQAWGKMIEDYLRNRENLKNVVLLVDIRHAPTADDKLMYNFIKYHRKSVIVVATKLDKITRTSVNKNVGVIKQALGIDADDIFITYSSETHAGREALWEAMTDGI